MNQVIKPAYTLIDTPEELDKLCNHLADQSVIAIDTEFVRVDTYYPRIGLIQVATDAGVYLVDPVTNSDIARLGEVLSGPGAPLLVLHACSEDIEVFKRIWDKVPTRIFDTQVASGFAGFGHQPGLQRLVEAVLGKTLSKDETRSNWVKRPLTASQLSYAADDVLYLLPLYRGLLERMGADGRTAWFDEEMGRLVVTLTSQVPPEKLYLKKSNAWKLDPLQLTVLQQLLVWREATAQQEDKPRGFVLKDNTVLAAAERLPVNEGGLSGLRDLTPPRQRRYGSGIIEVVARAKDGEWEPPEPLPEPLSREYREILKKLTARVALTADELGIPPELLARKKMLVELLCAWLEHRDGALPDAFQGWRGPLVTGDLIRLLEQCCDD